MSLFGNLAVEDGGVRNRSSLRRVIIDRYLRPLPLCSSRICLLGLMYPRFDWALGTPLWPRRLYGSRTGQTTVFLDLKPNWPVLSPSVVSSFWQADSSNKAFAKGIRLILTRIQCYLIFSECSELFHAFLPLIYANIFFLQNLKLIVMGRLHMMPMLSNCQVVPVKSAWAAVKDQWKPSAISTDQGWPCQQCL